jgi:uncharacterized protein YqeY
MLKERIENDLRQAQKEKEKTTVSTLRMLNAAILNAEIAAMRKKFQDEDVMTVIRQEVKKYKDSIEEYKKGEREDLVKKEEEELKILMKYLPAELSEEEIRKIVEEKVNELGASGPGDFGKVMGAVMKEIAGRAGGDKVGKIVKEMLEKIKS